MKKYGVRLAPVGVVANLARADGSRVKTRLTELAFAAQRGLTNIPVHVGHDTNAVDVGRLVTLTRTSWGFEGEVEIADGADSYVKSGAPVSIGYDVEESYVEGGVEHVVRGRIAEVSLVPVAAWEGAGLGFLLRGAEEYRRDREEATARANDARELSLMMRGQTVEGYHVIEDALGGTFYEPLPTN